MKKKLLLIALPALMVLAGCSNHPVKPVEGKEELSDMMLEDTTAHEELFGAIDTDLNVRKIGVPYDDPGSASVPRVGVQFSGVYERDVINPDTLEPTGEKVECLAVRYVAAIPGNLTTYNAVWTRGVSEVNSNQIKGMSGGHNSTEDYASLNDGGTPTDAPDGYRFVVYTMYDIPTSQANSYIAAYLTLTPKAGGSSVDSLAVVTEIDGGHCFSVNMEEDLPRNGYFLNFYNESGLAPTNNIVAEDNGPLTETDPNNIAKDNAMFSEMTFSTGDKIGAFRLTPTIFQFYGFTAFMNSSASGYVKTTGINEYAEAHRTGVYTIFLNKDNVVYFAPNDVTGLTFKFVTWSDWGSANARLEMYCFNDYNTETEWFTLTSLGSNTYSVSPTNWRYSKVIFVRMDKTKPAANWDSKWNQSANIGVNLDLTKTTFTLTQASGTWNDWGSDYTWTAS